MNEAAVSWQASRESYRVIGRAMLGERSRGLEMGRRRKRQGGWRETYEVDAKC